VQENWCFFKLFFAKNGGQICARRRAKLSKSKLRVFFISPLREKFERRGEQTGIITTNALRRIYCKESINSFTCRMLFDFILKQTKSDVVKDSVVVRGRQIPLGRFR